MKQVKLIGIGALIAIVILGSVLFLAKCKTKTPQDTKKISEATLLKEAETHRAQGNLLKVKEIYQKIVRDYPQGRFALENQEKIWDLNMKLLFSARLTPYSTIYEVKSGDTLGKIAKRIGTTADLIMKSNRLKSDLIRPGMKLKISTAKYSILVDKSQNTLTLSSNDEVLKVYRVSTGIDSSTPIGVFKVTVKLIDPTWYKAGAVVLPGSPKNILGTRWLGLSLQGYGIHGTTDPATIGQQVTAGCVRMLNKDIEELYTIVPTGTDVTIVD